MKSSLLFFLATAFLTSCAASGYEIVEQYDHLESINRTFMSGNRLGPDKKSATYELYLNALRYDWRTGEILYYLVVRYNADEWLLIQRGKTLTLALDGQKLPLWGEGSAGERNVFHAGSGQKYHSEQAWYQVTAEQLSRIASAKTITVQVRGDNGRVEENCSSRNLKRFTNFINKYVQR